MIPSHLGKVFFIAAFMISEASLIININFNVALSRKVAKIKHISRNGSLRLCDSSLLCVKQSRTILRNNSQTV